MIITTIKPYGSSLPDYIIDILNVEVNRKFIRRLSLQYDIPKNIIINMAIMLGSQYEYIKKREVIDYYAPRIKNPQLNPEDIIDQYYTETMALVSLIENDVNLKLY